MRLFCGSDKIINCYTLASGDEDESVQFVSLKIEDAAAQFKLMTYISAIIKHLILILEQQPTRLEVTNRYALGVLIFF